MPVELAIPMCLKSNANSQYLLDIISGIMMSSHRLKGIVRVYANFLKETLIISCLSILENIERIFFNLQKILTAKERKIHSM